MRRALLIVVALILYGSLYPWDFHARQLAASPPWILLHSWPVLNRYTLWDIAVNVTLYLPLGIFAYLAIPQRVHAAARLLGPPALGLLLSAMIEMLQLFDDGRVCSGMDVVSNVTGATAGMLAGLLYRARVRHVIERAERAERAETAANRRPAAPLLLICCWAGYQLFPLFPVWGRTALLLKLRSLGPLASIHAPETLLVFVEWLALFCLIESALQIRNRAYLVLLFGLPAARLFITSRVLAWSDVVGALAAFAVLACLPRTLPRTFPRAAALLLSAALVLGELSPFHFGPAHRFDCVPFRGFFSATWQAGFVILFRKSFWYGSVIWLWRAAGQPAARTTAIVCGALVALEAVQVYLPGRVPEITDAVLAALMGALLWLMDSPDRA